MRKILSFSILKYVNFLHFLCCIFQIERLGYLNGFCSDEGLKRSVVIWTYNSSNILVIRTYNSSNILVIWAYNSSNILVIWTYNSSNILVIRTYNSSNILVIQPSN